MTTFTATITYADNSTKIFTGIAVTGDLNLIPEIGSHITRKVARGDIPALVAPYTVSIVVT